MFDSGCNCGNLIVIIVSLLFFWSLQKYQYRVEGQKLAPKFSTSTGNNFWELSGIFRKIITRVFTGAAPRRVSTSSDLKNYYPKTVNSAEP